MRIRATKRFVLAVSLAAIAAAIAATPSLAAPTHPFNASLSHSLNASSDGCGAATDSHGFLYVDDYFGSSLGPGQIQIYDPSGALVTHFDDPDANSCGLAVDSAGNVYVQEFGGVVYKFNPSSYPVTGSTTYSLDTSVGSGSGVIDPGSANAVAVDPATDDVYVAHSAGISRFHSDGSSAGADIGADNFSGVDVYGKTGDVYANAGGTVKVFRPSISTTAPIATFDGSGSPGPPTGAMSGAENLAVDQSNGHVFVYDAGNNVVDEFESNGAYVSTIDHSLSDGFPSDIAVDNSGGANDGSVYVVAGTAVDAFGPLPQPTHPFNASLSHSLNASSDGCGAATDSHGFLYVDDYFGSSLGPGQIQIYDPSGALVTHFDDPDANSCGLAVDSAGNVYVQEFGGVVYKFNPSSYPVTGSTTYSLDTSVGSGSGVIDPGSANAVAVDPATDDVYVAHSAGISRFHSDGSSAGADIGADNFSGVDVYGKTGDVYANAGGTVKVFRPSISTTAPIATFDGSGSPGPPTGAMSGAENLAVDQSNGHVFVYDAGNNVVDEFESNGAYVSTIDHSLSDGFPSDIAVDNSGGANDGSVYVVAGTAVDAFGGLAYGAPPDATTGSADAIASTTATLNGTVNGNGAQVTDCHFDYVTQSAFDSTGFADLSSGGSVPCNPDPGSTPGDVAVSADLSGLTAVTPYRFRVVAATSVATVAGADNSFSTAPAVAALDTDPATSVRAYSATLNGHLDPAGQALSDCHFEYETEAAFQANSPADRFSGSTHTACVPDAASIGSGSGQVAVHAVPADLAPGIAYRFRLVATNAVGTTAGPDRAFTTLAVAFTDPATTIHHTSAVLNGHLDPADDPGITACSFDWGTDTSYGHSAACDQGDSFSGPASVTATIGGLATDTAIHYRLHLTTTAHGDALGADRTFTPPPFPSAFSEIADFGRDGTSATTFSNQSPRALAFDQAADRLFAVNRATPDGIYGFDASAPPAYPPLPAFNPLATADADFNAGVAVDNSATASQGRIYFVSAEPKLYAFTPAGAPIGGNFPISFSGSACGLAVGPAGDLWVGGLDQVRHFDSAGSPLAPVDVSAQFNGPPASATCSLATDSSDNLYVSTLIGSVRRYSAASGYDPAQAAVIAQPDGDSSGSHHIALDPATDRLYLAHPGRVSIYSPAGTLIQDIATGIPGADFRAVTVDAATHDVYVADDSNSSQQIRVFHPGAPITAPTLTPEDPTALTGASVTLNAKLDPESTALTDCHFDWGTDSSYGHTAPCQPDAGSIPISSGDVAVHADLSGLDPGTTYHFRISASNATSNGTATGPDQSFTTRGPIVSHTHAAPITDSTATLSADVNPNGAQTTFHFDYGTTAAYGSHTPESAPIGQSSSDHAVSADLSALAPATTYHFRIVATNSDATTAGPDATFTTAPAHDSCPNASLRTGFGFSLPDCRAYEQASPVDKHGGQAAGGTNVSQAADNGNAVTFSDGSGLPTSGGSSDLPLYVAVRGSAGWATNGLEAPTASGGSAATEGWSHDLSTVLNNVNTVTTVGGPSTPAVFLGDTATGTWQQVLAGAGGPLGDFASDPSHLTFESSAALAPGAVSGSFPGHPHAIFTNLYDLDHGVLTLAGRVPPPGQTGCNDSTHSPDCVGPTGGSFAGPYNWANGGTTDPSASPLDFGGSVSSYYTRGTLSADGARVFFTEGGTGRLYERVNATSTVQLNASQASSPDPNGPKPAAWLASTPSGSQVFFSSCERLTDESTAQSTAADSCTDRTNSNTQDIQGSDLYRYDTSSAQLIDLTPDANGSDALGADLQGLIGASADGSDVYFVANGDLDGAGPATPGDCVVGQVGINATCNLYFEHAGTVTLVARISQAQPGWQDWVPYNRIPTDTNANQKSARVAADGTLLFSSALQLGSYDNHGKVELYRYRPGDSAPSCLSCDPTGGSPLGDASLDTRRGSPINFTIPQFAFTSRNISADGDRVFFETPDKLVPSDTNGDAGCPLVQGDSGAGGSIRACQDVYEWEADGSGSCDTSGGCLYLLSTGTSPDPSFIADISASGDDAFIFTNTSLVPQDTDQLYDLYDARVGGGLASQHQTSPPPCTGDACQPPPAPPPAGQNPGSSQGGSGNKGHSHNPPTAKKHKKRCKKHHNCKKKSRRANTNPRGSK